MRRLFDLSLYLVTDRELSCPRSLSYIVEKAVSGGATMVQLREKDSSVRDFLKLAGELKGILGRLNIPLIINDRLDIAIACGADGIHVGQDDMPVEDIRRCLGRDALIGLSVESAEDAKKANRLDIDYIGISPVFTTDTKKELTRGLGLKGVREISGISRFPSVGIGGIRFSNTRDIIRSGADGVAVVSAICSAPDPEKAASEICREIEAGRSGEYLGEQKRGGMRWGKNITGLLP